MQINLSTDQNLKIPREVCLLIVFTPVSLVLRAIINFYRMMLCIVRTMPYRGCTSHAPYWNGMEWTMLSQDVCPSVCLSRAVTMFEATEALGCFHSCCLGEKYLKQ